MEWNELELLLTTPKPGEPTELTEALVRLDDHNRRVLSGPLTTFVKKWWKDVDESRHLHPRSGIPAAKRQRLETVVDNVEAVRLAVVGIVNRAPAAATWLRKEAGSGVALWDEHPVVDAALAGRRTGRLNRVLAAREPDWTVKLFTGLAASLRSTVPSEWLKFVIATVGELGLTPPDTVAFADCWLERYLAYSDEPYLDRLAVLRADRLLPAMLDALFAFDGLGSRFEYRAWAGDEICSLPRLLNALLEHGDIDRTVLIDGSLRRLLRGGRPGDVRPYRKLLADLAPTPAEAATRARDYLALLPDSISVIAGDAQRALRAADDAGLLTGDLVVEISRNVLFRTEKKLVREQLSWIDTAVGRHPEQRAALVTEVSTAFEHESDDVQARAVKLVIRHADALSDTDRALVAASVTPLPSAERDRLARVVDLEPVEPVQPEPTIMAPARRPDPERISTVAELAERLAGLRAMLRTDPHGETMDAVAVEPVLEALVEFAARDRQALAAAVKPVLSDLGYISPEWYHSSIDVRLLDGVMYAAARAAGTAEPITIDADILYSRTPPDAQLTPKRSQRARRWRKGLAQFPGPERVIAHRLMEVALRIADEAVPALPLSTSTDAIGRVEAATVIDRIRQAELDGRQPWEFDLQQALLRLPEHATADELAMAEQLTSPAGRRLADWLAGRSRPELDVTDRAMALYSNTEDDEVELPLAKVAVRQPEPVHRGGTVQLLDELRLSFSQRVLENDLTVYRPDWPRAWNAVVPRRRDVVAAHLVSLLGPEAYWDRIQPQEEQYYLSMLPDLAEADGPTDPALSACLGFGLNTPAAGERANVVEATVVLAARDQLDAEALGSATAQLVLTGLGKCTRIATALRELVDAGAVPQAWRVLATMLPPLLSAETIPNRASDLVELASRVAESVEARGAIEAVAATAARGGSSKLVKTAKRLHRYLTR